MALKQVEDKSSKDRTTCPRCGSEAWFIEGKTIKWLICPRCKFKKLMEQEEPEIKVVPLLHKDKE